MNANVTLQGITKTFRGNGVETPALRGIDLDIGSGELLMLVGPSGCGKTTLLSILAGILDPDAGQVEVLGQNLTDLTGAGLTRFRRKNLGFVFQAFNLIPALTVAENVAVPLLLNGMPRKTALEQAEALVATVGLKDRHHHRPQQLSGGQQQRVAIARALVHEPRLVVCDEPTSALDHHTGELVMDLLRSVAVRPGRSLVVVTHDSRIFRYADRVATMDDGQIVRLEAGTAHSPQTNAIHAGAP